MGVAADAPMAIEAKDIANNLFFIVDLFMLLY